MTDNNDAVIEYSVKELLKDIKEEQTRGFSRLETSMAHKADRADLSRLEERVVPIEREVADLQTWRHGTEQVNEAIVRREDQGLTRRQWLVGTLVTAALVAEGLLSYFH